MTTTIHEVVLDERRRTSLARVGHKDHHPYLVEELSDGTIVLKPAVTIAAAELDMLRSPEVLKAIKQAMDPSARRRRRPLTPQPTNRAD
ncbi:MAG: hypothetical protein ACRDX8_09350 [Acidimicrobiales bacterium]